jgi:hypothetical protein
VLRYYLFKQLIFFFFFARLLDRARDTDHERWCGGMGGGSGFLKMVPLDRGDQCGHFGGKNVV